jgi:hypothetical protein
MFNFFSNIFILFYNLIIIFSANRNIFPIFCFI